MQAQAKRDLTTLRTFMRSERLRRNISQQHMANYLGISQNTYSKLELGYIQISVEQLLMTANIFEMRVEDLVNFERVDVVLRRRESIDKLIN